MSLLAEFGQTARVRKRVLYDWHVAGQSSFTPKGGGGQPPTPYQVKVAQQQLTVDHSPTGWPLVLGQLNSKYVSRERKRALRRLDHGNEFYTERQAYTEGPVAWFSKTAQQLVGTYSQSTPMYGRPVGDIKPSDLLWPKLDPEEMIDLWGLGSTAIKQTAPVQPSVSLSTTLGELREGLPKLAYQFGSVQSALNSGASNHLGWQFGVKPMLNDIGNIRRALDQYDRKLAQLEKESGELLHRKFRFDTEQTRTHESTDTVYSWPSILAPLGPVQGVRTTSLVERHDTWFSGAFSYYFPRARTGVQELNTWLQQFGVGFTPDTFWNLTPYTWLMDWFGNFGDVVFNTSYLFQNSQVINYAYLMRTTHATREVTWSSPLGTTVQEFSTVRKLRIRASPFGFGVQEADLTPQQLGILAALGITRVT